MADGGFILFGGVTGRVAGNGVEPHLGGAGIIRIQLGESLSVPGLLGLSEYT